MIHTRVTRHRRFWHLTSLKCCLFKSGRNEVFKTMLTGSPSRAFSNFFLPGQIPLVPRPLFRSCPLTESLEQAMLLLKLFHRTQHIMPFSNNNVKHYRLEGQFFFFLKAHVQMLRAVSVMWACVRFHYTTFPAIRSTAWMKICVIGTLCRSCVQDSKERRESSLVIMSQLANLCVSHRDSHHDTIITIR